MAGTFKAGTFKAGTFKAGTGEKRWQDYPLSPKKILA